MARSKEASASSQSVVLIACVLAIAVLYFGRHFFIPLALAFVFSFLLTPFVSILEKFRLPRVPAVVMVLALFFALGGSVAWGVARQLVDVMVNLADYKTNLDTKINALRAPQSGTLSKATATLQELNKELESVPGEISSNREAEKNSRGTHPARPIPVQVAAPPSSFVQDLRELLGPLAEPLETAAIVIIFTLFMLIKREDLRNRAIRLAGRGQLNVMTQALDDAGRRLSRFLLMQCLVNAGYGIVFGSALYFIGVPNALLWGVVAGVLRFVPYVGSLAAGALPVLLALAIFPGWHVAALSFGAFVILELAVSNVVEPVLYGAHTGISSLAILVAAVFWATIWGPVGLVLSTPLTVCLIVLGRHVPQLNFLEVVLGDEPVLLPEQCFYQRLLAMDQAEARSIAETQLRTSSLEALYENVFLPALKSAEQDLNSGGLDDPLRHFISQTVHELIEELGDPYAIELDAQGDDSPQQPKSGPRLQAKIACVPASGGFDELVAAMLAQVLQRSGYDSAVLGRGAVEELSRNASIYRHGIVCVSSISPLTVAPARSLCRRLTATVPGLSIVLGFWSLDAAAAQQRLGPGCSGLVSTTLSDALLQIRGLIHPKTEFNPESVSEPVEAENAQRAIP